MASFNNQRSSNLSKVHSLQVLAPDSVGVEECSLEVGNLVCYYNIRYAAWFNRMPMVFLNSLKLMNKVSQSEAISSTCCPWTVQL